ncbi:MAG: metalloregulator ArsR/SmtB family transcription factor [Candidatus Saccharicenans sp.]|jgi:ArsR family transcriptional regulator|nr:metalloregulator ArsR/SmtB family transcription factor [Candidatus Saccharicenans sp.]
MKLEEALNIFRLLSDRTRLRIFLLLLEAELCVGELMALLQIEQSLISHQLKKMRQVSLVEQRKSGRWIYYRIPATRRQQLEPVLREWLKEELVVFGRRVKAIKEKQVCFVEVCRPGQAKAGSRPKASARAKGRKKRKS